MYLSLSSVQLVNAQGCSELKNILNIFVYNIHNPEDLKFLGMDRKATQWEYTKNVDI